MNIIEKQQTENTEDAFDTLLDDSLEKITTLPVPDQLKNDWSEYLEESENFDDLKERVALIKTKYNKRLALSQRNFSTYKTENHIFEDVTKKQITHKEILNDIVTEALEGKYELAGRGMSAAVFTSKNHPEMCYKIITNSAEYETCVSVKEEMGFLSKLADVEVGGVRVPKAYYYHMSPESHLCIMEKLNAASLQEILDKKHTLPDNFDIEEQFENLRKFFDIMHSQYHIHHRDFHEGNIMFSLDDGTIYVIDFGKGVYTLASEGDMHEDKKGRTAPLNDNTQLENRYMQLKRFLEKKSIDK